MKLKQALVLQGEWLFQWRSFVPLGVLPLLIIALNEGEYIELNFGGSADIYWDAFSVALAFLGLALRLLTVGHVPAGTSGRNTRTQKADALNRTGMYSVVRHPLYVANYLIFLGLLLFTQAFWLVLAGSLAYWMYYERIIYAEEEFLDGKFGALFSEWACATPAVLPDVRRWVPPHLPFSVRSVVAREHATLLAIAATLAAIELLDAVLQREAPLLHPGWLIFLGSTTMLSLLVRAIKKKTRWLRHDGR